jgi:adenylate kinase family enzyme
MFLLGAPCAGKSTLVPLLREALGCPVLDMDDELLRLNGGAWPALDVKRALTDKVLADASGHPDAIVAHSYVDDEQLVSLKDAKWLIGLLDLPEHVMRSRAAERLARDGWSNVEWLPWHLHKIDQLRAEQAFSYVFDATLPTATLARAVADIMRTGIESG